MIDATDKLTQDEWIRAYDKAHATIAELQERIAELEDDCSYYRELDRRAQLGNKWWREHTAKLGEALTAERKRREDAEAALRAAIAPPQDVREVLTEVLRRHEWEHGYINAKTLLIEQLVRARDVSELLEAAKIAEAISEAGADEDKNDSEPPSYYSGFIDGADTVADALRARAAYRSPK